MATRHRRAEVGGYPFPHQARPRPGFWREHHAVLALIVRGDLIVLEDGTVHNKPAGYDRH
jgi:hypothetical protein